MQKHWRHVFSVLFISLLSVTVFGQYNETIRTGRPGQSIGPFTTGKNIFQIQSGMDVFGASDKNSTDKISGFLNNTVIRYGISETFEVSALVDYIFDETVTQSGEELKSSGLRAMDVGMRYHIIDGDGKWLPNIGFQIRMRLPILAEDYKIDHVAPRFNIVTSNPLGKGFTLVTNTGASWNGNSAAPRGFYIVNLSWPFSDKLGGFVENYGSFANGPSETFWDAGVGWLLNPDLQLDIFGGFGVNDGIKSYFTSVGVSWRTKKK